MSFLSSCRLLSQRRKKNYFDFSVNCTGNEAHLTECRMGKALNVAKNLNATCAHGMPAVISCVPGRAFAPTQSLGFRKAYRVEVHTLTQTSPCLFGPVCLFCICNHKQNIFGFAVAFSIFSHLLQEYMLFCYLS